MAGWLLWSRHLCHLEGRQVQIQVLGPHMLFYLKLGVEVLPLGRPVGRQIAARGAAVPTLLAHPAVGQGNQQVVFVTEK